MPGPQSPISVNGIFPTISGTAGYAYVVTAETTTSTSYTDLTTTTDSVTVVTGTKALVIISAEMQSTVATDYAAMAFAVSGATTLAAGVPYEVYMQATGVNIPDNKISYSVVLNTLSVGSNTFKMKYKAIVGGTATFQKREISVIPL